MSTITFTRGDADQLERTVVITDVLPDTLAKAWLTIKRRVVDTDAQAAVQKAITPTLGAAGHIDDIGSASPAAPAHVKFLLTAEDTNALDANVLYYYDIKGLTSTGAAKVLESGRALSTSNVTRATS